jgi:hypothetical protein
VGFAVATIASLSISGMAHAQSASSSNTGNGMKVSPVRTDLTVKPGESQTVDISIENITSSPSKLKAIVNDFEAGDDESGKPRILLDPSTSAPSHGLKQYVDKIDNFDLKAKERKNVKVRVSIPTNAAGGGYYGVVRFLPQDVEGDKNLSLSASVGTLILVTVPGNVKEQMSVASLNVSRGEGKASNMFTSGSGLKATVRFRNTGNVQESPFGKVQLKKGSKLLGTFDVNNTDPAGSVLPDSIRRFTVDFGDKTKTIGKYSVEGNFGYASSGQLISAKTSFYVIPLPIIITAVAGLLLVIATLVIAPRMMKRHDRKLMRKLGR